MTRRRESHSIRSGIDGRRRFAAARRARAAFSLLEVMAALALLAVGVLATTAGQISAIKNSSDSRQASLAVYNRYGEKVAVRPWLSGSAPFYIFTERLQLPLVFSSPGHGDGAHAPNEYMLIKPVDGSPMSGLDQVEKYYVDLIHAIAER